MSKRIQVFCALTFLSAMALAATGWAGADMGAAVTPSALFPPQADAQ
ncbi:hypothetical protein J7382_11780 [Shimia sp. R11_0]|nr:hypothetical protein [Shimia sp. R11_0]MBO9478216.1 hypothetical protein [Shimia sp. R11_0]